MADRARGAVGVGDRSNLRGVEMSARLLVSVALCVVGGACAGCGGGAERTYDADEVRTAFRQHEYALAAVSLPPGSAAAEEGVILRPVGGARFLVIVGTDRGTQEAWPDYVRLKFPSFRRANVFVTGLDGALGVRYRPVARAALEGLPDRGKPVEAAHR